MQTFNAYTTPIYTPKEYTCPICGKLFYPENALEWVYKLRYKDNPDDPDSFSKNHLFCSWTCFRVEEKHQDKLAEIRKHPNARLTDAQKEHMKARIRENKNSSNPITNKDLAFELGVSRSTIEKYVTIVNWETGVCGE